MSIGPIDFPVIPTAGVSGVGAVSGPSLAPVEAPASADSEFGSLLIDGLDRLEGLTDRADNLAVEAATGRLENIHDYTIAASEAQVATQLTVALRNKAVEAFNEIMRMQV